MSKSTEGARSGPRKLNYCLIVANENYSSVFHVLSDEGYAFKSVFQHYRQECKLSGFRFAELSVTVSSGGRGPFFAVRRVGGGYRGRRFVSGDRNCRFSRDGFSSFSATGAICVNTNGSKLSCHFCSGSGRIYSGRGGALSRIND